MQVAAIGSYLLFSIDRPHLPVSKVGNAGNQLGGHGENQQCPYWNHCSNGSGHDGSCKMNDHPPGIIGPRNLNGDSQPQQGGGGIVYQCPAEKGDSKEKQEQTVTGDQHQWKQAESQASNEHNGTGGEIPDAPRSMAADWTETRAVETLWL